jgi:hypothetical protein
MGNRHTFDLIISNRSNFEVVSANQSVFDIAIRNRHEFELLVSEGFAIGYFWELTFQQTQQIIAIPSLSMHLAVVSSASQTMLPVVSLDQAFVLSASSVLNGEVVLSQALNIGGATISGSHSGEPTLQQRILIGRVEESSASLLCEPAPDYRHYFLLDNFSGSMLSDLDDLLLQTMDYEVV